MMYEQLAENLILFDQILARLHLRIEDGSLLKAQFDLTREFLKDKKAFSEDQLTAKWDDDFEKDGYDEGIVTYDLYGLPDGLSEDYVTLGNEFKNFESQKFALIFGSCFSGGMFDDNDDLQAPGRVICSACEAYQYGWDYLLLGNTLFGYYFVDEAILQGKADGAEWYGLHTSGDKDGQVSMEEALAYAYPRVIAEEPDSQPQIYDGFAGELIP